MADLQLVLDSPSRKGDTCCYAISTGVSPNSHPEALTLSVMVSAGTTVRRVESS